jgi:hypothetical protein
MMHREDILLGSVIDDFSISGAIEKEEQTITLYIGVTANICTT